MTGWGGPSTDCLESYSANRKRKAAELSRAAHDPTGLAISLLLRFDLGDNLIRRGSSAGELENPCEGDRLVPLLMLDEDEAAGRHLST